MSDIHDDNLANALAQQAAAEHRIAQEAASKVVAEAGKAAVEGMLPPPYTSLDFSNPAEMHSSDLSEVLTANNQTAKSLVEDATKTEVGFTVPANPRDADTVWESILSRVNNGRKQNGVAYDHIRRSTDDSDPTHPTDVVFGAYDEGIDMAPTQVTLVRYQAVATEQGRKTSAIKLYRGIPEQYKPQPKQFTK